MDASTVSRLALERELGSASPPLIVDVRARAAFLQSDSFISGALRRSPDWISEPARSLPAHRPLVVYCEKGGDVGKGAARHLVESGLAARFLSGGIRAWMEGGGVTLPKPIGTSTRWVTRERPKVDRIACPWLIRRFIDRDAEFRYVKSAEVAEVAAKERAIPFDIPDTLFSHVDDHCSFDAFLKAFRLDEPALGRMARVIRGADTGRLDMTPESAGLLAASLGLSRLRTDDQDMLRDGLVLYDALYLWAKDAFQETHTWNPDLYRPRKRQPHSNPRIFAEPFDSGHT